MPFNQSSPSVLTVAIAAGAALSGQINLGAQTLHGILVPLGWTAADLTFQVSVDGGVTWSELSTSAGTALDYPVTAGHYVAIDPTLWRAINCIKIRSGTAAAPVNQVSAVNLTLALSTVV